MRDMWKNRAGQTVAMSYHTVRVFDTEEQARQWLRSGGGPQCVEVSTEGAHQMSRRIVAQKINDAFCPVGRTAEVEGEVARELARDGNAGCIAILNTATGAVATVKAPKPYFSKEEYDRRCMKQRGH